MDTIHILLLVLGVAVIYALYRVVARLFSSSSNKSSTATLDDDARRNAALENFKNVHKNARDDRKRVGQIVKEDTKKAAKLISKMLKQK